MNREAEEIAFLFLLSRVPILGQLFSFIMSEILPVLDEELADYRSDPTVNNEPKLMMSAWKLLSLVYIKNRALNLKKKRKNNNKY